MMEQGFVAPSINLQTPDPEIPAIKIATETIDTEISVAMSNSFGFGGTNGCIVFGKV